MYRTYRPKQDGATIARPHDATRSPASLVYIVQGKEQ